MLDDLRPMGPSAAARQLGVDLFEVVRLMVAAEVVTPALGVSTDQLATLRQVGGIDSPWWTSAELPEDEHPLRQRVRATLGMLLSRGHVGSDNATRMDNLWRGLPEEDQAFLQSALTVLGEEGHLQILATPVGVKLAVHPDAKALCEKITAGATDTPGLTALYQD